MSNNTTPVEMFFQLQRDTIKGSQEVLESTLAFPKEIGETFGLAGESGREMRDQSLEMSRESLHRTIDLFESIPGDSLQTAELRDSVDETFDSLKESNEDACNSMSQEYDRFEEEILESYSDQIELLVDLNEQLETQIKDTVETLDEDLEAVTETSDEPSEPTRIEVSEPTSDEDNPASESNRNDPSDASDEAPAGKVECRVCGGYYKAITHPHLQTHDMTVEEYRERFGQDAPLRPEDT